MVIDNRRLEAVKPGDQLWIRDTVVQLSEAAGITQVALVVAPHGLAKMATDEIRSQTTKSAIVTRTLSPVSEAMDWETAYRGSTVRKRSGEAYATAAGHLFP